ncbi:MAG: glycosyltransferase [Planctomycetota bacterium]
MPNPTPTIIHFLPRVRLRDGGIVRAVLDLAELVAAHGCRVRLIGHEFADLPETWVRSQAVTQAHGPPLLATRTDPGAPTLVALARLLQPDSVLHLHGIWEPANRRPLRLARRLGRPAVLTSHGMLDDWAISHKFLKKRLYLGLFGRTLFRDCVVHCTADAERDQARRWTRAAPVRVLPLAFEATEYLELFHQPARYDPRAAQRSATRVLFLSRLHPVKGLHHLLEAITRIPDTTPIDLQVAGDGEPAYAQRLHDLAQHVRPPHRVSFLGLIGGQPKLDAFANADLFVLPTAQENFGFAVLEAMAAGLPALTTPGTDLWREFAAAGVFIADPNPATLAKALVHLAADPGIRQRAAQRARQWVRQELHPPAVADRWLAFYRSLLDA